ncbi:MAG: hypothetical protein LBV53_02650, partial [Mycoplasmataceae bacterium]|nr:hypothetical protein [Mycoplasmataceae bacterium]
MSVIQQELIHSIKEIAKEKKLSDDFVVAAVKDAIIKEYTREYVDANVDVEFDLANNNFAVYRVYTIVSDGLGEDFDDYLEITLDDAKLFNPNAQVGGTIKKEVLLEKLDKKLIQNIWNSFKHNLNSEANKSIYKEWQDKKGTVGFYEVAQLDGSKAIVKIAKDVFGVLPYEEQIKGESLIVGKKYHFAIVDVLEHSKDWPIIVSRTDDTLFMYLLKKNVPEIEDGIIEVKRLARIPGVRTKIAVVSTNSTSG